MGFGMTGSSTPRLVLGLLAATASAALAGAPTLVALGEDGRLVAFAADRPGTTRAITPSGLRGRLVGIDVRPADGRLYGLTGGNDVYRIDPAGGACELVSSLTAPFDGDVRSGVDFTPQLDRLRLVSGGGQNLRVNVTIGATAVDPPVAFAKDDPNAGRRPRVAAAAYTNNLAGTATTRLLEIDADLDALIVQDPANDGVLRTIGPLGIDFGPVAGFDIVTDAAGRDQAYAASGDTLYTVDLGTGRATAAGTIGSPGLAVASLAVVPGLAAP